MTFLPVAVEPVNAILATSGWRVRRVPKIVGVDNDVDYPRGQNISAQLTQF